MDDVDRILKRFNVTSIVVGHTRVPTVTPLYDGKVIAVQVYPHRDQQTNAPLMEGLSILRGELARARIDGGTESLSVSKQ